MRWGGLRTVTMTPSAIWVVVIWARNASDSCIAMAKMKKSKVIPAALKAGMMTSERMALLRLVNSGAMMETANNNVATKVRKSMMPGKLSRYWLSALPT